MTRKSFVITNLNSSNVKHCPQFIKNTFLCILSVIVRINFSIRPEGEGKNESILCKNSVEEGKLKKILVSYCL